jgi:hypothetical protein
MKPPGFTRSLDTFTGDKLKQDLEFRPYGFKIHEYSREVRNPLASDGKNLWNELARKEGSKIILARADDLDAAMQRAADRLRQG